MGAHLRRRCICCRGDGRKPELLRFVVCNGAVVYDSKQKLPGRGVYVHRKIGCWTKMNDPKRWSIAFRPRSMRAQQKEAQAVVIKKEDLQMLMEQVQGEILELSRAP